MTPEELIARVRELDAKATPGQWITGSIPWKVWANGGHNTVCDVKACGDAVSVPGEPSLSTSDSMAANRDLIAFYRTAAPTLADALESETRRRDEISGNYKQMDEWNGRLVKELEAERAKLKVARDALKLANELGALMSWRTWTNQEWQDHQQATHAALTQLDQ